MSEIRIEELKRKFRKGDTVKLISMSDPWALPPGTSGVIDHVDDAGTIHVNWETGSTLGLIPEEDRFIVMKGGRKDA